MSRKMLIRQTMVKGEHSRGVFKGSPVSLSIAEAIMDCKYVNAVSLYRLEAILEYEDIEDNGLDILLQANIEAEQIIHNMNH
ncbi:hypothetical protein [Agathobacter rectalis]|uniref:Uncharacterized protein n=1 Tax=Agathobacter rectalis TaxID=39491 RepID=A0A412Q1E7_9FIRM|nr:hypothetical protein [Agathobacter rectalis]RGT72577.1 hypothetical protein DWX07_16180 [Agathobacter rectalis]RGT79516.1 hypothetical protein DWX06_12530 [Agathobacter rectalis]